MFQLAGALLETTAWLSVISAVSLSVSLVGKAPIWQILLSLLVGSIAYIVLHVLSRTVLAVKEAIRLFPQVASDVAEARNGLMDAKKAIAALEERVAGRATQEDEPER